MYPHYTSSVDIRISIFIQFENFRSHFNLVFKMEDRSALFNQLKNFSQRGLRKVETKVVTASGEQLVEKRGAKGLQVLSGDKSSGNQTDAEPPKKLDLQVGLVLPGFLLGELWRSFNCIDNLRRRDTNN